MSKWREKYEVHPAADVFPMMTDEELKDLGEDIKKNGLLRCITIEQRLGVLIDGRNRLEAMERAGVELDPEEDIGYVFGEDIDAISFVISANIKRRHLTKQQQADLIVAAVKAGITMEEDLPT